MTSPSSSPESAKAIAASVIARAGAHPDPENSETFSESLPLARALLAANEENDRMRKAIDRALEDSESGNGWGPDVTVCAYLREARGSRSAPGKGEEDGG